MSTADEAEKIPTSEQVLADPAASHWLKAAIGALLQRDPIDAATDAATLAAVLAARADAILGIDCQAAGRQTGQAAPLSR